MIIHPVARVSSVGVGVGDGGVGMNGLSPLGNISFPMYAIVEAEFYPTNI